MYVATIPRRPSLGEKCQIARKSFRRFTIRRNHDNINYKPIVGRALPQEIILNTLLIQPTRRKMRKMFNQFATETQLTTRIRTRAAFYCSVQNFIAFALFL